MTILSLYIWAMGLAFFPSIRICILKNGVVYTLETSTFAGFHQVCYFVLMIAGNLNIYLDRYLLGSETRRLLMQAGDFYDIDETFLWVVRTH